MQPSLLQSRLPLFPITTRVEKRLERPCLTIGGCDLVELAEQFGTPLYVYDQATLEAALEAYQYALHHYYPGESGLTYAAKAFLCVAMAQWVNRHALMLDCSPSGELYIALAAGVRRERILIHGVNKDQPALLRAVKFGGVIVIDNMEELARLALLSHQVSAYFPSLWLRLRPGQRLSTHAYLQTGQEESKFGLSFEEAAHAVRFCREHNLPLNGLHFHLGSNFHDPSPLRLAIEEAMDFVQAMRRSYSWLPQTFCPGGGWGVAYHEDDLPHPSIEHYVQFVSQALVSACERRNLPLPRLQLEPGRSLVARAGVALYRLGAVKYTQNRRWLLLDGGLADNPRPALYQARYTALPVLQPDRPPLDSAWLGGPYCESGDVLIENLLMPDVQPGELIAIPVSGAYQLSMGSNYNGAFRPAVLWLHNGRAHLIQRRETPEDLIGRDFALYG